MKVLIVGGAGYVAGAVTDILIEREIPCRVYDLLVYGDDFRKPVPFVRGDVRDYARLQPHLDWADSVLWLAALVGDPACQQEPEAARQVNADAVRYLAEHFDGRVVFLSTCSVMGAQDGLLDETSPTGPLSVYAETKLEAEGYLSDSDSLIYRLGTLFGVGDRHSRIRLDLVVNTMTWRAYAQGVIEIRGGKQFRPLLHVRDAAQAVVDGLTPIGNGVYNLHLQNVRIADLAHQVRNHFPDAQITHSPMPESDLRDYRVSSDRARDELAFCPTHTIDDGIGELKRLFVDRRIYDPMSPRYNNARYIQEVGYGCPTVDR